MSDECLTTPEYAKLTKRSVRSVIRERENGTGPAYVRLGKLVRYHRQSVLDWIAANEVKPVRGVAA